jgi:cyanophycin synthetase
MEIERVREGEKRVVYFSTHDNHLLISRHLADGGTAYFVRGNWVIEAAGAGERRVLDLSTVPATMGGTARYQVSNVLAATAACRARAVAPELITSALANFRSAEHNPGRGNLYRVASGGYVMLDYGHNPDAFEAVCQMTSRWEGRRVTGIIGVPGDRDDSIIEAAGRVAARGFDRLVIKEDADLRGRERGEVARLLCRAASEEAPELECRIVLDDTEALADELRTLAAGNVVVVFYDKLEPLLRVLQDFGATPAEAVEGPAAEGLAARSVAAVDTAQAARREEPARPREQRPSPSPREQTGAGSYQHYVTG